MSFRTVAVAGNWSSVTSAAIQQAPLARQQPPFSIFETQGQQQWVMMPAWSAVMIAAQPVALVIDDCAKLDVLMKQVQVHSTVSYYQQCQSDVIRLNLLECLDTGYVAPAAATIRQALLKAHCT